MRRDAVAAIALSLVTAGARADDAGSSAVNVLALVEPIRAVALGGAGVAVPDPALAWLNPAAAGRLDRRTVTIGGSRDEFGGAVGQVHAGMMIGPVGVMAGVASFANGDVVLNDSVGGTRTVAAQRDLGVAVTGALPVGDALSAGASVKYVSSELLGEYTATAVSADLGAQYALSDALRLGVAVRHLGSALTYLDAGAPAPLQIAGGAAWTTAAPGGTEGAPSRVLVSAEAGYRIVDALAVWGLGAEYQWRGLLAGRVGTRGPAPLGGASFAAGLGIAFRGLRLDYSLRVGGSGQPMPQALSLTAGF